MGNRESKVAKEPVETKVPKENRDPEDVKEKKEFKGFKENKGPEDVKGFRAREDPRD